MKEFEITSSNLNSQYTYKDDNVVVNGGFQQNAQTNEVTNISGQMWRKDAQGNQGDYICNFNGFMRDGEMQYSVSDVKRKDAGIVWDAIDEIEANIMGENQPAEEE